MGPNNAIHIRGQLNNSATLDLIFDTGASIGVLSDEGVAKNATLSKDNKNKFEFAGLRIENSPAIFVNYNGSLKADGVIGYDVFEDKILEINYDKSILVVHSETDTISKTYSVNEMIWKGTGVYIKCVLNIHGKTCKGDFLFDTGSKWALSLTKTFAAANGLYNMMPKVGRRKSSGVSGISAKSHTVVLPQLAINDLSLTNIPIDLELPSDQPGLVMDILGNDVLKRFNVILDYRKGLIYLQLNSLVKSGYNKSFDPRIIFIATAILITLFIAGFVVYRRRKVNFNFTKKTDIPKIKSPNKVSHGR